MKILEISEQYFGANGILVPSENHSASFWAFIKNIIFVVTAGPLFCAASGAYIYYNPDQFENSTKAFTGICTSVMVAGQYSTLKLNEERIKELIEMFRETVDEGFLNFLSLSF